MTTKTRKPVILTGDRTTGPLHIGHYAGSLKSRLELQDSHDQFLLLADTQALTDNAHDPDKVRRNVVEVALDYLAVGIDPGRSTICLQSHLPALAELSMLYLNFVTVARLERNPTIKDEIRARGFGRDIPAGFLCYPAAQAADITGFRATVVPVGEDQAPLIEQCNEIVRRINAVAGGEVVPEARAVSRRPGGCPGWTARPRCRNRGEMRSRSRPRPIGSARRCGRCIPIRGICGRRIRGRWRGTWCLPISTPSTRTARGWRS